MSVDESLLRLTRCPQCLYELRPTITSGQSRCPKCGHTFSLCVPLSFVALWWLLPASLLVWASAHTWATLLFFLIEGTFDLANNCAYYGLMEAVLWPFLLALFLLARNRLFKWAIYVRWSITVAIFAAVYAWYFWGPAS